MIGLLGKRRLTIVICLFVMSSICMPRQVENDKTTGSSYILRLRQPVSKPGKTTIDPSANIDRVIVKLVKDTKLRLFGNKLVSLSGKNLAGINKILSAKSNAGIEKLVSKPADILERKKNILENKSGHELADFNNYITITVSSTNEAQNIINQLNALPEVEIAYAQPHFEPAGDIDPPTPNYSGNQDFLRPAPGGVDADYAQTVSGGDGAAVKLFDIEGDWIVDHEDLDLSPDAILGGDPAGDFLTRNHGTAVMGIIKAGVDGFGVSGISSSVEVGMASYLTYNISEGILLAVEQLDAGDIILIEINAPGPRYNFAVRTDQRGYICIEYWQDIYDALQYAWAKGIIVVEAAGNGAENLGDALYENMFDTTWRNSHAIMVGAGAPPSGNFGTDRSWLDFSNYGERVNVQGHGREVVTAGYGDLFNGGGDEHQYYTGDFNGTSSATAIVAGVVASLQGIYKNRFNGVDLDADRMRDILVSTGSPQQGITNRHIGPRPDIQAADAILPLPYDLTITPYFIDTAAVNQSVLNMSVLLENISIDQDYDFTASAQPMGEDNTAEWINIQNPSGVIFSGSSVPFDFDLSPEIGDQNVGTLKGQVLVQFGTSGEALDDEIILPIFLEVLCEDTTYFPTIYPDHADAEYNWINIESMGYIAPSHLWYNNYTSVDILDDGSFGPIALEFDFPFYDTAYSEIYLGANGAVSFTDADVNFEGFYDDLDIPGAPFKTVISPFWNDLNMDPGIGGHGRVYYYRSPERDTFIVQYNKVGNFNSSDDTLTTFQIILSKNGNIKFQYKSVGTTGLEQTATIGIAAQGCSTTPYVIRGLPEENIIGDETAILFDYTYTVWEMSGDANNDGNFNVGDAVYIINMVFKGGPGPVHPKEADANCDGQGNVGDAVYMINNIFKGGPLPCMYAL
ncbi:MAG: S8 family serine peptidase [Candidatus Zixiibacteriota bacterium]